MSLGAKGVINRKDFDCWGQLPKVNSPEFHAWTKEARKFGKAIWEITGKKDVDIVFEHPGEATFPVSAFVVKRGGMVVFCAGTTGFNITFDARYVWMRQKRIQGSHFAHLKQASAANQFVLDRRIDPCMSEVFPWDKIPAGAHQDVEEPAPAGQHGLPGQFSARRPPDRGGRDRGRAAQALTPPHRPPHPAGAGATPSSHPRRPFHAPALTRCPHAGQGREPPRVPAFQSARYAIRCAGDGRAG